MDYISLEDPNGGAPAWKPPITATTTDSRDNSEYRLDFGPLHAMDLVARRIEFGRKSLGLTTEAVARMTGIDWHTYAFHVETSHRDIFGSCGRGELTKLCAVLDLRFFELFDMDCDFCNSEPYLDEYALPINELICARRVRKGWSRKEFGDRIGFLTSGVEELETNPEEIRNWWLDIIEPVAYELELPAQIILEAKCANCGR